MGHGSMNGNPRGSRDRARARVEAAPPQERIFRLVLEVRPDQGIKVKGAADVTDVPVPWGYRASGAILRQDAAGFRGWAEEVYDAFARDDPGLLRDLCYGPDRPVRAALRYVVEQRMVSPGVFPWTLSTHPR